MRRYLASSFPNAFLSSEPAATPTADTAPVAMPSSGDPSAAPPVAHPPPSASVSASTLAAISSDALPPSHSAPPDAAAPSSSQQLAQQQQQQPPISHNSSSRSYVPSLGIAIPSVRKYLFSSSNSNAAATPAASAAVPEPPAKDHKGHLPHLPHLPTLRRRNSADKVADASSGSATSPSSSTLPELCKLVDKALGPVGQLTAAHAKRVGNDRLIAILNHSVQARHRILTQFLRARHYNAPDAMHMLSNALRWRHSVQIDNFLSNTAHNMRLPSACFPMAVISSPDICKQPVVYGLIRLLDKKKAEREPFHNALVSFLESCYFADTYTLDEMVVILDFRDWSIRRNTPYRFVKDGIQTLQDYYPERLGRVFLVNYPTTIRAAFTVISPIIDAGAKEKIVWISDADPSATLLKYISPTSIPTFLGGELKASFPPAWPDIEAEFAAAKASSQSSYASIFHH